MPRLWSLVLLGSIILGVDACAPGFEPFFDGKCLRVLREDKGRYENGRAICTNRGALPATIRSKKENDALVVAVKEFTKKHNLDYIYEMWIGLKCDTEKGKFVWEDGTVANYTNFEDKYHCYSSTSMKYASFFLKPSTGLWKQADYGGYDRAGAILCLHQNTTSYRCPTDMDLVHGTAGDTCISLTQDALSWTDAETKCSNVSGHLVSIHDKTVNNYISDLAQAQKKVNGIHIGAYRKEHMWKDGTNMDYVNYFPGFPDVEEYGDCVAMQIRAPFNGRWVNVACDAKLYYACGRPAFNYTSSVASECPSTAQYRAGDSIYSPGFPNNATAMQCDNYVLRAPKGKRIEVSVVVFETNLCCDSLTLYDGLLAEDPMLVLRGVYSTGTTFKSRTNVLRMTWNATSAVNVRGFHLQMRQF